MSTSGPDFSEKLISYDANGNILSLTRSTQAAIGYSYDANKPNRLNSVSGGLAAAYTYDANGNMTSDNTRGNFTYDHRNLPVVMALSNSGVTVNIQSQTLSGTYANSSGDSTYMKDVTVNSGSTVTIESKRAMKLEAGFSSNGATVSLKAGVQTAGSSGSSYIGTLFMTYDNKGQRVKYLKGSISAPQDGSRIYIRGMNGQIICEYKRSAGNWTPDHYNVFGNGYIGKIDVASNKRFYAVTDNHGSTRVVLKDDGQVESWSNYYPFGKLSQQGGNSSIIKEKFTGKEYDDESGLNYFGARYYNADIGRWVGLEPLDSKYPSLTGYAYSANNPIILVDINGFEWKISERAQRNEYFMALFNAYRESDYGRQQLNILEKADYLTYFDIGFWHKSSHSGVTATLPAKEYSNDGQRRAHSRERLFNELPIVGKIWTSAIEAETGVKAGQDLVVVYLNFAAIPENASADGISIILEALLTLGHEIEAHAIFDPLGLRSDDHDVFFAGESSHRDIEAGHNSSAARVRRNMELIEQTVLLRMAQGAPTSPQSGQGPSTSN